MEPTLPNADTKDKSAIDKYPALSHCRELRELEISLPYMPGDEMTLFSSITSTNLRKIVLPLRYEFGMPLVSCFERYPQALDDCLYQLVQRLRRSGYKHRLELAFQTIEVPDDEVFEEFLPKFREQGRVKLISEVDGRVFYSSDQ